MVLCFTKFDFTGYWGAKRNRKKWTLFIILSLLIFGQKSKAHRKMAASELVQLQQPKDAIPTSLQQPRAQLANLLTKGWIGILV